MRIPVPPHSRHLDLGSTLDGGTSSPATAGEILGQLDFRQSTRKPKPSTICHYADFAPPGLEKSFKAFDKQLDLVFNPTGELPLQRVAQLIQFAGFGPAAAGRVTHLIGAKILVASGGKELAEAVRCQRLVAIRRRGKKVLPKHYALDILSYR